MGYWIIKAKPDRNDFKKFPLRGQSDRWYTSRIPKLFRRGDSIFIWAGAPTLRAIGRARLVESDDGFDGTYHHFVVKYLTNCIEGPTIEDLRRDPTLRPASFLKAGPAGTVFPLTLEQGRRLSQRLDSAGQLPEVLSRKKVDDTEEPELRRRLGALFGDSENNRKVEKAAILAAKRHYRGMGWQVKSVEKENIGFDLRCRKARAELHVEVKGASGVGTGFVISRGEYQTGATDSRFELCLVESVLSTPRITTFAAGEMFEEFRFAPLAYKAVKDACRSLHDLTDAIPTSSVFASALPVASS